MDTSGGRAHFCAKKPCLHIHISKSRSGWQPRHHYTGVTVLCAVWGLFRGLIPATLPGVQLTLLVQGKLQGFKACLKSLKSCLNSRPVSRVLLATYAMPSPMQLLIVPKPHCQHPNHAL